MWSWAKVKPSGSKLNSLGICPKVFATEPMFKSGQINVLRFTFQFNVVLAKGQSEQVIAQFNSFKFTIQINVDLRQYCCFPRKEQPPCPPPPQDTRWNEANASLSLHIPSAATSSNWPFPPSLFQFGPDQRSTRAGQHSILLHSIKNSIKCGPEQRSIRAGQRSNQIISQISSVWTWS